MPEMLLDRSYCMMHRPLYAHIWSELCLCMSIIPFEVVEEAGSAWLLNTMKEFANTVRTEALEDYMCD